MRNKLFDSGISPRCEYCQTGIASPGSDEILCRRMGVMQADSCCKKFRYDPLKRKPKVVSAVTDYSEDDFKL